MNGRNVEMKEIKIIEGHKKTTKTRFVVYQRGHMAPRVPLRDCIKSEGLFSSFSGGKICEIPIMEFLAFLVLRPIVGSIRRIKSRRPGTDVMILKIFSPKNLAKK
jgi:hypothetical protein